MSVHTHDQEVADRLLESLQEGRRARWIETTESMDFRRSSRHAWQLIRKLDPDKTQRGNQGATISASVVARDIKQRSHHTPNHAFEKQSRKEYQRLFNSYPLEDERMTRAVGEAELSDAIKCLKTGKAAGADGIYPEMLTHLGGRAITWLAAAMTDIINKSSYPLQWKQTNMIAILKPGKPPSEPGSYRPISL